MSVIVTSLIAITSVGLALYGLIGRSELVGRIAALENQIHVQEQQSTAEIAALQAELAPLEKVRKIPNIIERGRRLESEIAARLEQARQQAEILLARARGDAESVRFEASAHFEEAQQQAEILLARARGDAESVRFEAAAQLEQARRGVSAIIQAADRDAEGRKIAIARDAAEDRRAAGLARTDAERQARQVLQDAQAEARKMAAAARKEAKEKVGKVDEVLDLATKYAAAIREKAEARAEEIGGLSYEALRRHDFYEAAAQALKHRVEGYVESYPIPSDHVLDELAYSYGFHQAGERLKLARDRVRIMERNGTAATCLYPDGWKRDYAISFVLGAFNGRVDAILARIKPAQHGKLAQEIRDTFALTNKNGEVFRNARIHDEFLDARLEELKWGVAVQKIKEQDRDEQRALRDQIKEEEKARKEREKAVKQAEREEGLLAKALERARQDFDHASAQDRERYEAKLHDLAGQLRAAEEKSRRAVSMAQQTKCGHVYVISNVGSFGADVYKIGLTRRLNPQDRVRELGGASVPFAFDVHALIYAEDAPALEAELHRQFREAKVNKVNRRKEFFRLPLAEIRAAIGAMNPDVRWSLAAEAQEYHDTLALEARLQGDAGFRRHWAESEAAFQATGFDEDEEPASEDSEVAPAATLGATKRARTQAAGRGRAMIEDEIDGPGLKVASARFVFWLSFAVNTILYITISYVFIATLITIQSRRPGKSVPLLVSGLVQAALQLSIVYSPKFLGRPIVDRLLRRRGLVRPPTPKQVEAAQGSVFAVPARTTTVETWARGPGVAPKVEPVEVPFTLDAYILSGLSVWGLAAVGTPLAFSGSLAGPGAATFFLLWFGGLFAGLMILVGVWAAVSMGGLVEPTRVDVEGVWGYPHRLAFRRRFAPWSAVAACRVETDRDARGRVLDVRPTLIGLGGEPLMRLQMPEASVADQERLVRAILARTPKAADDPDGPA